MAATFPEWIERQTLVARNLRIVFVPTLKSGCTSVMWALAEAEGTLAPDHDISELGDQSREQTIHNPRIHGLPVLASLHAAERNEVLNSADWTRFCVTRDPYARLVSAWMNRAFLYSTGAEQFFVSPDPDLGVISTSGDVAVDVGALFRSFVGRLVSAGATKTVDPHFAPQYSLIRPDVFPYTDVVALTELREFSAGLDRRLDRRIGSAAAFTPVARNVSLGLGPDDVVDSSTAALIERFYADDFDRLGYAPRTFPSQASPLVFSAREMALVRMLHERSDRLRELATVKNPPRPWLNGARRVRRAIGRRVRPTR